MTVPQELQSSTEDILADLIAFDTTSHRPNLPLLDYIEHHLARFGIASDRVVSADGRKANLFATIGPADRSGVCLSGHTDVVPVAGQDWTSDPFVMRASQGRLYGRGTSDMKGFIACALAALPKFAARPLKTPIHFAFSHDEEIGCVGVRSLLAELGHRFVTPRMTIVGEPTSMRVVDAHKGPCRWIIEITGRAVHSSMAPLGVNAISYAGRIINELRAIEIELSKTVRDDRFEPPYSTLQVTEISGGTATNIVPVSCRLGFEVRALPSLDVAALQGRIDHFIATQCIPEMQGIAPEACIKITNTTQVPPFGADAHSDAVALALMLTGSNETAAVSYATEAGLFQDAGSPAVVCGPGDIAQAHTADEWIARSELAACDAFMARLADWAAA